MLNLSSYYPQPVVAGTTAGTYAEGDHSHELDELDASGIAAGKVLTASGSNTAAWSDPTGAVEEAPEDGIIYGRKDAAWVDMTAPANLQVRRGTAAEVAAITPLEGEPVWATDTKRLVVGDGVSLGGVAIKSSSFAFYNAAGLVEIEEGVLSADPFLTLTVPPLSRNAVTLVVPLTVGPDITSISAQFGSVLAGAYAPLPTGVFISGFWSKFLSNASLVSTDAPISTLGEVITLERDGVEPAVSFNIVQHGIIHNSTLAPVVLQVFWTLGAPDPQTLSAEIGTGAYLKLERMD